MSHAADGQGLAPRYAHSNGNGKLTWNRVSQCRPVNVFSKDDSKAGIKVEVNVAMEEPGSGVVGLQSGVVESREIVHVAICTHSEPDRNIIAQATNVYNVSQDGIEEIRCVTSGAPDNPECVL